jgi:hypothetical protein
MVSSSNHPAFHHTIAIGNIENLTNESRLTTYFKNKLAEQLSLDGTFQIRPDLTADHVLDARILSYDVHGIGEVRIDSPDNDLRQYRSSAYEVTVQIEYILLTHAADAPPPIPQLVEGKALFSELVDIDIVRKDGLRRATYDACEKVVSAITQSW